MCISCHENWTFAVWKPRDRSHSHMCSRTLAHTLINSKIVYACMSTLCVYYILIPVCGNTMRPIIVARNYCINVSYLTRWFLPIWKWNRSSGRQHEYSAIRLFVSFFACVCLRYVCMCDSSEFDVFHNWTDCCDSKLVNGTHEQWQLQLQLQLCMDFVLPFNYIRSVHSVWISNGMDWIFSYEFHFVHKEAASTVVWAVWGSIVIQIFIG